MEKLHPPANMREAPYTLGCPKNRAYTNSKSQKVKYQ